MPKYTEEEDKKISDALEKWVEENFHMISNLYGEITGEYVTARCAFYAGWKARGETGEVNA